MSTQVQERLLDPMTAYGQQQPLGVQQAYMMSSAQRASADVYSSQYPPFMQAPGEIAGGVGQIGVGIGSVLQGVWNASPPAQLWNMMQQLWQYMQQQSQPTGYGDNEQYYTNASGGSNGDPHLSFNGSAWDNMGSQPDLLHSDSIPGGFQISTQTTPPQANGVTYNQNATVTTNNGQTQVSLDKNGNATITQNGNSYNIQPGATYDLGNGETVQRNANGSLAITCTNGSGGQVTTTMTQNGNGVDVNAQANNVDLGGALVNGQNGTAQPGGYRQPLAHMHHHHNPLDPRPNDDPLANRAQWWAQG